jgi:hypothetical protein
VIEGLEMSNKKLSFQPLLDRRSAATYLGVAPGTLAAWDSKKKHDLKPRKIGKCIRYRLCDLDKFIEGRLRP